MQDIQELRGRLRSSHSPKKRPRGRHGRRPAPPPKPAVPAAPDSGELPESYGVDKVVVLPVGPYLVHVYWDLAPQHNPQAGSSACLRFSESGGPGSFEVNIDLAAKSWYVHLWSPEKRYSVELALRDGNGGFVSLARSNPVETPRAWPVAEVQEQFGRVENSESDTPVRVARSEPPLPAPPAVPLIAAESEQAILPPPEPPTPISSPGRRPNGANREFAPPVGFSENQVVTNETAAPAAASAAEDRRVPPPDAATVLRQRLTELYALRWWREAPAGMPASFGREIPLPAQLLPPRPEAPGDLTSRVEQQFSPGFSSSLLALRGQDRPAD